CVPVANSRVKVRRMPAPSTPQAWAAASSFQKTSANATYAAIASTRIDIPLHQYAVVRDAARELACTELRHLQPDVLPEASITLPLGFVEELIGRCLLREVWVRRRVLQHVERFVPGQRRLDDEQHRIRLAPARQPLAGFHLIGIRILDAA